MSASALAVRSIDLRPPAADVEPLREQEMRRSRRASTQAVRPRPSCCARPARPQAGAARADASISVRADASPPPSAAKRPHAVRQPRLERARCRHARRGRSGGSAPSKRAGGPRRSVRGSTGSRPSLAHVPGRHRGVEVRQVEAGPCPLDRAMAARVEAEEPDAGPALVAHVGPDVELGECAGARRRREARAGRRPPSGTARSPSQARPSKSVELEAVGQLRPERVGIDRPVGEQQVHPAHAHDPRRRRRRSGRRAHRVDVAGRRPANTLLMSSTIHAWRVGSAAARESHGAPAGTCRADGEAGSAR